MHGTLLALTLAAYLLTPSSFLSRLWNLTSGRPEAPASKTLGKEGPRLDPSGVTVSSHASEEGPGLDPDGAKARTHASDAGPGLDPSGHS
jgi:hypothetical protein